MKNSTKMISLMTMILSTIMAFCSENWITMWMSLEINMISFILMMKEKNKNSSQSMMSYFLIQSMSSMMFIFSISMSPMILLNENFMKMSMNIILMTSMMMKLGCAPLHEWFIWIFCKMNWYNCLLLSTWQKIIPMIILTNSTQNEKYMILFLITSIIIGAIGGINQTSMKKIIAFSSINHMGWLIMLMLISNEMLIKYMIIYMMMMIMLTIYMKMKKINFINQMNMMLKTKLEKFTIIIMMLSLGGMPPMIGFMPKWMTINSMMMNSSKLIMMIMLMMSMITLFYYIRTMTPTMMMFSNMNKWEMKKKSDLNQEKMIMLVNFMLPMIMMFNLN